MRPTWHSVASSWITSGAPRYFGPRSPTPPHGSKKSARNLECGLPTEESRSWAGVVMYGRMMTDLIVRWLGELRIQPRDGVVLFCFASVGQVGTFSKAGSSIHCTLLVTADVLCSNNEPVWVDRAPSYQCCGTTGVRPCNFVWREVLHSPRTPNLLI